MKILSFRYQEVRILSVRLLLKNINNNPGHTQFFTHEFQGVHPHLKKDDDSIKSFVASKIERLVRDQFPSLTSYEFEVDLAELYYKPVGKATIFLNGKNYNFTINEDGQWQVSCEKLTSGVNLDYTLMFNKLDELKKALRSN